MTWPMHFDVVEKSGKPNKVEQKKHEGTTFSILTYRQTYIITNRVFLNYYIIIISI